MRSSNTGTLKAYFSASVGWASESDAEKPCDSGSIGSLAHLGSPRFSVISRRGAPDMRCKGPFPYGIKRIPTKG